MTKKTKTTKAKKVNGVTVAYSPVNQAYFVLWGPKVQRVEDYVVLKIVGNRDDLRDTLKWDLGIDPDKIQIPRGR